MMIIASVGFATMGALVKLSCATLSVPVVVFGRSLVVALGSAILLVVGRAKRKATNRKLMWLRSVSGFTAMCLYFYSISHVPLANAVTLQYSSPIFVVWFAGPFLGEHAPRSAWIWFVVAFCGVLFLLAPDLKGFDLHAIAAVGSAALSAIAYLSVRGMRSSDHPDTIVYNFALFSVVASTPGLAWMDRWPTSAEWLALFGVGAFATMGQALMTRAYRYSDASYVSTFSYATVLFSAGYSLWVFEEDLPTTAALGTALIVASGTALSWIGRNKNAGRGIT